MKNSVLIAIHYMELGGAEMSLLGLLESLDYSETEVDLFVYNHRGELMRWIPEQVNLLPEIPQYKQIERPIKDVVKEGFFRRKKEADVLYDLINNETYPVIVLGDLNDFSGSYTIRRVQQAGLAHVAQQTQVTSAPTVVSPDPAQIGPAHVDR